MNINDFQNLSRDEQFAEAGRIAGVEPSVFDGIWRTESGRGADMLSPKGAEGHFGLMPATRATWEGRFGQPIDPYNFGQSLFTSAHTLAENRQKFKNVPDALRAYNGGWDPKKWGNPETAAYVGKVLGADMAPAEDVPAIDATAEVTGLSTHTAHELWNTPFQRHDRTKPPAKPSKVAEGVAALEAAAKPPLAEPTFGIDNAVMGDATAAMTAKDKLKEDTSLLDIARAGSTVGLLHESLKLLFRDPEPADPNFVPPEDKLKGRNETEQRQLRAAQSVKEFNRLLFEQDDAKEQNEIVFRRGAVFGIGATMLADLPAAAFTGGITTFSLGKFGIGALNYAAQGRKAAALGSLAVEGVAGNVLYTAALDALGQHQGLEQYAISAAGGLLTPILGGRAIGRAADAGAEVQTALRMVETARAKQAKLAEQAQKNLGEHASSSEIAQEMDRLEAEGIRADTASHKASVPESRRFNVGEEEALADAGLPPGNTTGKTVGGAVNAEHSAPIEAVESAPLAPVKDATELQTRMGTPRVAEAWHDSAFGENRVRIMETSKEAQAVWAKNTDGISWEDTKKLKAKHTLSPQMEAAMAADPVIARAVKAAQSIADEYLPNTKFVWSTAVTGTSAGASVLSVGRNHAIALNLVRGEKAINDLTHELGHAVYHQYASKASPRVLGMIEKDWLQFVNDVRSGKSEAWDKRFSASNDFDPRKAAPGKQADPSHWYNLSRDEMMAEQFVTHIQNRINKGDYGQLSTQAVGTIMKALVKVLEYFKSAMAKGLLQSEGAETFFTEVLRTSRMKNLKDAEKAAARVSREAPMTADASSLVNESTTAAEKASPEVLALQNNPVSRKYGLDLLPMSTPAERATAKQIVNLYTRADAWATANPVNEKRMNKILSRFDAFDPVSNRMLRSANPVVRMVASELLENGGGAAGRRSSAAIAKYMGERAIIGNVINELDDAFNLWHRKQPNSDRAKEFLTGQRRVQFNRLVAEEIEQRRYPTTQQTDLGQEVRVAADSVESSFERARMMQTDAKTVGWAALPESSRGYMPHRMRPDMVRSLTLSQKRAVHGALMDQFVGISGFDMSFADQLASKYLDRIQRRALGGFDAPVGLHQTGAADVVKEALEAMGLTRPELDAAMKKYATGGAGHTKKRLNLDLRQSFTNDDGTAFRLMDLFDTDMLSLVRGQSQRVSGEVALARHGVMGKPGIAILRDAMGYGDVATMATKGELEAFDQAAAEFLGAPFGTQNKWVDRAMVANSVASLGGMGFNQLGELINVGTTLGVKSALSNVTGFGRLNGEIRKLARGQKVDNPIIGSLEKFGGAEFGTDAYKMVFPMDLPDAPIHTMGADTLHFSDKLLRGAGHLQSKLSGWRVITSVQQRGVAEQTVHAIMQGLRKGENNFTLRDIGISDEVMAKLREDLPNIAEFNGDKLVRLDITKASDMDAANQLVQSVHRGVNQMIQGTFIGETGKYVHNSYLKLLTQFRSFSLTAIDKQWNRQAGNRGVAAALAMTVGAMSAAAPIYMVRTYLASVGRKDQEEFLDRMLSPGAIARATTNYIATAGLAGDFLDAFTSVTGTGAMTGGRSGTNTQLVGNLIAPALGKADKVWGAMQDTKDGTDVHGLIKEGPFSRLPFFIPAVNALGH